MIDRNDKIELKRCPKCGQLKELTSMGYCKPCRKAYNKQYRQAHRDEIRAYKEAHRDELREYQRQWNEDNAEHVKDYKKQYYKDNKQYYEQYNKQYYQDNTEHLKDYKKQHYQDNIQRYKELRKKWYEEATRKQYIYMLIGQDNEPLYIGSTKINYRPVYHLKGFTHLELKPADWEQLGLTKILYIDVTDITQDDDERLYIESLYIEMFRPSLNIDEDINCFVEYERMAMLEDIVYNNYVSVQEIDVKKIISQGSEITFNYDNLILN